MHIDAREVIAIAHDELGASFGGGLGPLGGSGVPHRASGAGSMKARSPVRCQWPKWPCGARVSISELGAGGAGCRAALLVGWQAPRPPARGGKHPDRRLNNITLEGTEHVTHTLPATAAAAAPFRNWRCLHPISTWWWKAADSDADVVFLDLEDARRPAREGSGPQECGQAAERRSTGKPRARPCRCASTGWTRITCIAT